MALLGSTRRSRRSAIVTLAIAAAMVMSMAGVAPAAPNNDTHDIVGRWVANDVDDSFWQMSVSASGHVNSIDSGTVPCEDYRTRLWGELESTGENLYVFTSLDLRCLAGPSKGTTLTGFGGSEVVYDPVMETLTMDNPDPWDDTTFCRMPCDP
jgi:hypothetical protein